MQKTPRQRLSATARLTTTTGTPDWLQPAD